VYEVSEKAQSLNTTAGRHQPPGVSVGARLLTALICLPGLFTLNRTIEVVPAALILIVFWFFIDRRKTIFHSARAFIFLTPCLVLINSLLALGSGTFGLSLDGALIGFALSARLFWTFLLISLLFRSTPPEEMITLFRKLFKLMHIPEQECNEIVTMTLTILPDFSSLRVKSLRNLPEAIAQRITESEKKLAVQTASSFVIPSAAKESHYLTTAFRPLDLALILPAALFLILTLII